MPTNHASDSVRVDDIWLHLPLPLPLLGTYTFTAANRNEMEWNNVLSS